MTVNVSLKIVLSKVVYIGRKNFQRVFSVLVLTVAIVLIDSATLGFGVF